MKSDEVQMHIVSVKLQSINESNKIHSLINGVAHVTTSKNHAKIVWSL